MLFRKVSAAGGAGIGVLLAVSAAIGSSTPGQQAAPVASLSSSHQAVLKRYCVSCHTQAQKARGTVPIALDTLDLSKVSADAEAWEKVVRKLRAGVMPPAGAPRPDRAYTTRFWHGSKQGWIVPPPHAEPGRTSPPPAQPC